MKKILSILLCFLISGCNSSHQNQTVSDKSVEYYKKDLAYIKKCDNFTDYSEKANMRLYYTKIKSGYRYDLIIDEPKQNMYHIQVLAYSKYCLDDYQPTIGYFDHDSYSLIPHVVNKNEHIYKGISLSGRVSQKNHLKILVQYYSDKKAKKKSRFCFEVKDEDR